MLSRGQQEGKNFKNLLTSYAGVVAALYNLGGGNLGEYVKELCWNSENVYVKTVGCGKDVPNYLYFTLQSELELLAERFALERGGRSARLARQFIDGLLSK